jgi:hypothetical protein
MKAQIAVATVSGKAYYLIVNELKNKNVPFVSLLPKEPVPAGIKVVITTKQEKEKIVHKKILVYKEGIDPASIVNEALQIVRGKRTYEKIVIGVDPGEVFGLAVLADGKVLQTENSFSIEETSNKINTILKSLEKTPAKSISIKVGDGVLSYKERLLRYLDSVLPSNVMLESVSEAGTNRYLDRTKHRRGLRDIFSAIKIAGREGKSFKRRKINE